MLTIHRHSHCHAKGFLGTVKNCAQPLLPSLALLCLAVPGGNASAAQLDNLRAPTSTPTSTGTEANHPAWLKTADSPDLSYGSFDFHPRLRVGETYDDNILFAQQGAESDFITQTAPGIQILGGDRQTLYNYQEQAAEYDNRELLLGGLTPSYLMLRDPENWPDRYVLLDYSPQWQNFAQHTGNDSLDQFVTFNALWPMAKLVLGVQENYTDQKLVLEDAQQRAEIRQDVTALNASYRLSDKFSLDSVGTYQSTSYPGTTNLTGYSEWKGTFAANRQMGAVLNAGLVLAGGVDKVTMNQGQEFVQLGGRLRYYYSEILSADASAGMEYRSFDSGRSPLYSPYLTLGVNYNPWQRTFFRLGLIRQNQAALQYHNFDTQTGGYVSLHRDFTDRYSAWLNVNYFDTSYNQLIRVSGTPLPTDYYSVRLTGSAKVRKYLEAQVYYQFSGSGLIETANHIEDNSVGLQVSMKY